MRKTLLALFMFASLNLMGQQKVYYTSGKALNKIPRSATEKTMFTYKLIPSKDNTFGYDIFANGVLIFHQEEMPGQPDGKGFSNKEDAEKVAKRVILKLERPVMQPIVSTAEFQMLGIK